MRPRPAVAVLGALLAAGALAGCANGMPRTSANVAICTTLARVLESKTDIHRLAGLAFEADVGCDHEGNSARGQSIGEFAPFRHRKYDAEVTHRDLFTIDFIMRFDRAVIRA